MANRLKEKYRTEVFEALKDKFNYSNPMEVPKLEKITINMGLGEAKDNSKIMESAVKEIALIADRSRLLQRLESPSLTSRLDRVCRLVQRLH